MEAKHGRWFVQRHEGGDARTEVGSVRAVPFISESTHQAVP
jgi:hypothetical protein